MNQFLELSGLDGSNPIGFLAALGTLAVLHETGETNFRLGWRQRARWVPFLEPIIEQDVLTSKLMRSLCGEPVSSGAEVERASANRALKLALKRLKKAENALKETKLRGAARNQEFDRAVLPVREEAGTIKKIYLEKLKKAVPRLELSIGNKIEATADIFRSHARDYLEVAAQDESPIRMLSAFISEDLKCRRTEFDFVDSSGQLAFLATVRELMGKVTGERLYATLFFPWKRQDEKWSLRFDPAEDRRYALLDRDPTAGDNKSLSEWMATLLAYRSLVLFPSVLTPRGHMTTGWSTENRVQSFTWPIWQPSLTLETISSLLVNPALTKPHPGLQLKPMGVSAVYKSNKIANGDYVNFTPSVAI